MTSNNSHNSFFTHIYKTSEWDNNNNNYYVGSSGGGSTLEYNIYDYIPYLRYFIIYNKINTVVDLGCGDFICGKYLYNKLNIKYTGYDIYDKLIDYHNNYNEDTKYNDKYTFHKLDIYNNKNQLVNADLCILKDILQHWYIDEIYDFMDYIIENKKYKYILICNSCNQTYDYTYETSRSIPLSAKFLPLKKYNPEVLLLYKEKEVSVIKLI
jgi:hypothetical protein